LTPKIAVPSFRVKTFDKFIFVNTWDDLGDDVVVVKECVVCHYAAQLTFPVPPVILVTLSAPTVDVVPTKPAPMVIVKVFGYLRITTPEPPLPTKSRPAPDPPPVFTPALADSASTSFTALVPPPGEAVPAVTPPPPEA
jgi:hypothetical protein